MRHRGLIRRLAALERDPADAWESLERLDWRRARVPVRQQRDLARRVEGLLRSHPDERVRQAAARFLGAWWPHHGSIEPRLALLAALESDPSAGVRAEAAEQVASLSECRRGPLVERVAAALGRGLTDPDGDVRFWCLYGVGLLDRREHRAAVDALVDDPHVVASLWSVGEEARDVLRVLDGEPWPEREPARP